MTPLFGFMLHGGCGYGVGVKQTLYLSSAVHRRCRKPRAVKRSGTECGLRAVAQISVAFANRAGLAGAAKQTLRSDRQSRTRTLPDWP
jgi:hypothetical protein